MFRSNPLTFSHTDFCAEDLVAHIVDLPDHPFVITLGDHAEVVGPDYPFIVLKPGKRQRMQLAVIYVVTQHDHLFLRCAQVLGERLEPVARPEQGIQQFGIHFD